MNLENRSGQLETCPFWKRFFMCALLSGEDSLAYVEYRASLGVLRAPDVEAPMRMEPQESPCELSESVDVRNVIVINLETLSLFLKMHLYNQRRQGIFKLTISIELLSLRLFMSIIFYRIADTKSLS